MTKWQKLKNKIKLYFKLLLNWRFLVCFGLAWMITNGWSYLFIVLGRIWNLAWMVWIGTTYLAFLWLPFTVEKVITIAIAIFLVRKLFKKHRVELEEDLKKISDADEKTDPEPSNDLQ